MASDELTELLEMARYKEIASEALYTAGQEKTQDPSARALMKTLVEEERGHARRLDHLKAGGIKNLGWCHRRVPDLMASEYLVGGDTLEGAGLQDTLTFAMKHEQEAIEFYSKMMGALRDEVAKRFCKKLAMDELEHKLKLELRYDDLFRGED